MAETIAESIWKDGQLNTARRVLRQLLTDRFGPLPQELLQRIESSDDLERLLAAVSQVSRLAGPDDLKI